MREGMRTWCIRLAWTLLIACGAMLLGLRLGRPLYYTDGQQPRFAGELAHAGMLDWPTPRPQVELPGPVLGRVAALPDGRLLYGRTGADGSSDLVVFDPTRPGLLPEPAFGLNTPHHELAPAVGTDGRIWFSSDRPGGAGGYDLYVAPFAAGSFGRPEPVSLCNTSRDETDPAPSPVAGELVFVRLEPQADGRGTLMLVDLGGDVDPAPLLPFDGLRRAAESPNDRDPVFDRDGAGLWFLRQVGGERPRLFRMARVGAEWDAPRPIDERWGATGFRSPLPLPGFELRVLAPRRGEGEPDLWFAATGRELQPWWPGQQWLELVLLAGLIVAAVLLLLLYLGRRWTALDLVTQCLLLSLLVHLLLMLWLMRVEIVGSLLRGDDEAASGLEVTLVSAEGASAAADGPRSEDLAAMAAFTPEQRSLAAAAPAAAAEAATRRDAAEMGPDGGVHQRTRAAATVGGGDGTAGCEHVGAVAHGRRCRRGGGGAAIGRGGASRCGGGAGAFGPVERGGRRDDARHGAGSGRAFDAPRGGSADGGRDPAGRGRARTGGRPEHGCRCADRRIDGTGAACGRGSGGNSHAGVARGGGRGAGRPRDRGRQSRRQSVRSHRGGGADRGAGCRVGRRGATRPQRACGGPFRRVARAIGAAAAAAGGHAGWRAGQRTRGGPPSEGNSCTDGDRGAARAERGRAIRC
ncbi:MAG: hypothetical protein IPK26_15350 [Planctomycetes bacterium]|nr:hypothetical protein [Planctomycetota bacterium]